MTRNPPGPDLFSPSCPAPHDASATPNFQRRHDMGIDLIVHAASKYPSGHRDTHGGLITGSRRMIVPGQAVCGLANSAVSIHKFGVGRRAIRLAADPEAADLLTKDLTEALQSSQAMAV